MILGLSEIDETSKVPKYQQVADMIISSIGGGTVKLGERIPSIKQIIFTGLIYGGYFLS